jgi:hypothetical protein
LLLLLGIAAAAAIAAVVVPICTTYIIANDLSKPEGFCAPTLCVAVGSARSCTDTVMIPLI